MEAVSFTNVFTEIHALTSCRLALGEKFGSYAVISQISKLIIRAERRRLTRAKRKEIFIELLENQLLSQGFVLYRVASALHAAVASKSCTV
jgi:hypothetical protein